MSNSGNSGAGEKTSELLGGLSQIRSDRSAAIEAADNAAYTSKGFLLDSIGIDIDYLTRTDLDDELDDSVKDMLSLTEIFDRLISEAHKTKDVNDQGFIGPVVVPGSGERYRQEGDSYIGGLALAAQAWDKPILVYIDDVNVRIEPDADREGSIGIYHQKRAKIDKSL